MTWSDPCTHVDLHVCVTSSRAVVVSTRRTTVRSVSRRSPHVHNATAFHCVRARSLHQLAVAVPDAGLPGHMARARLTFLTSKRLGALLSADADVDAVVVLFSGLSTSIAADPAFAHFEVMVVERDREACRGCPPRRKRVTRRESDGSNDDRAESCFTAGRVD